MKRQTRSALLCQLFNERLPICQNLTQPVIAAVDLPVTEKEFTLSLDVDDKTGFRCNTQIIYDVVLLFHYLTLMYIFLCFTSGN
jgi:hypothetical protein